MAKIKIQQGVLLGGQRKTESGFEFYEFIKIPYAEPPVGDLRFKSPRPPKPWQGERDATISDNNNIARQTYFQTSEVCGTEDCLYLNVNTPSLPSDESKPLPVMVYIHGGGFVGGNGIQRQENGPDFLIEHGVVVVTINYRLDVFGFLSLDIPEASGNMGLKDQVQALKWVQENISAFNGDKDNVTIFGVSAGSASVEYHILSKQSAGLFSKAILQSGSATNHWTINLKTKELSIKLAFNLGYEGQKDDIDGIHKFLMKQTTEALCDAAFKTVINCGQRGLNFGFVPSIEKDFENAFLTEYPYEIFKKGSFNKVPNIRGFCEYEGMMIPGFKPDESKRLLDEKKCTELWKYPLDDGDIEKYNDIFSKLYLEIETDDKEGPIIDFFSHYDFTAGIIVAAKMSIDHGVPTYVYMFAYNGSVSLVKLLCGLNRDGASHGDDLGYVIRMDINNLDLQSKYTEEDKAIRKSLTKIWTDFAKTGNPTPALSDVVPVTWPAYDKVQQKYLVIDSEFCVREKYQPERIAVFEEIYEKYRK